MTSVILNVRKFHPEGDGWHMARVCPDCGLPDCDDASESTYHLWLWLDDRMHIVGQIEYNEGGMFYGRLPDVAAINPTESLAEAKQNLNAMANEYITFLQEKALTTKRAGST